MSDHVQIEIRDGIARVVLDRPDRDNALTREMLTAVRDAADSLSKDATVRAVQLRATGPVFCPGMEVREMLAHVESDDPANELRADSLALRDALWALFRVSVPTIAVVQGPVAAGGIGLALACDLVLAAESATFQLPEPRRGTAAAIVTPLLVYRTSVSAASRLLIGLSEITADEAVRLGLCHHVAAAAELDALADDWTNTVLEGSRSALATTKKFLMHCGAEAVRSQLDSGTAVSSSARASRDAIEGLTAVLEGRPANWID